MDYTVVEIELSQPEDTDYAIAYMVDLPFESFEQNDRVVRAYTSSAKYDEASLIEALKPLAGSIKQISSKVIKHQNWNAVWEQDYQPVNYGFLVVRAPFHPKQDAVHEIVIDPNMSFGTGHHETTSLMVELMHKTNFGGKRVLDFGAGSGILAIWANKLNARKCTAVEIDEHAAEAARSNALANNAKNVEVICGGIEAIGDEPFDVILANINKNAIEAHLDQLLTKLKHGGVFICSGFLESDTARLCEILSGGGLEGHSISVMGDWAAIKSKKA
ncbi:MAG: 50S ribosomal protein L11 methyltransferase [Salibacteraceae bacterium]